MKLAIVTLFPEMFSALTDYGISGRAISQGIVAVGLYNPRTYTSDRHQTVDARPYGGGPGMVMTIEPLRKAILAAKEWTESGKQESSSQSEGLSKLEGSGKAKVVYLSPQGRVLDQSAINNFAEQKRNLVLVAGRYEGIDERLLIQEVDEEWSIGDYVVSGGELPAMVLMDALMRQLPGVLGHEDSAAQDSFAQGLLDYPHYTRPEDYRGERVPDVLLSGNHKKIRRWRLKQSLARTLVRRPDLITDLSLDDERQELLSEIYAENDRAKIQTNT